MPSFCALAHAACAGSSRPRPARSRSISSVGGDDLRRLGGLLGGALEREQPLAGVAEQALDAVELEALVLQPADQLQPLDVLGPVVARPAADLGRREQPARVMGAHVAHREAGLPRQLVDRQHCAARISPSGVTSHNVTSNDDTLPSACSPCSPRSPRVAPRWTRSRSPRAPRCSSPSCCCGSASATARGRVQVLGARSAASAERVSGLPAWAAIPAGMIVVSLITALFGMLWDISLHIAQGRDEGPLANVAHYFILAGLFGVFASGFLSMCLPLEKPSRVAVRDHARLVRAARRRADRGLRHVLADRLPARRRLAPAVRPGRDAVGPDAPDADRRRGDDARRARRAAGGGGCGQPRRRPGRAALGALHAPDLAAGRVPARALDVPGRVRLRRARSSG